MAKQILRMGFLMLVVLGSFSRMGEAAAEAPAILSPSIDRAVQSDNRSFLKETPRESTFRKSYLLARNQAGDNWRVVIDSKNRLSLVNDHEQLNGDIRQFHFFDGNHQNYRWPLRLKINPAETKVAILNQENRRTIRFASENLDIQIRSDFDGRTITMQVRSRAKDGKWNFQKATFDYNPYRGIGKLTTGTLDNRNDGKAVSTITENRLLGIGNGYQVTAINKTVKNG